MKMSFVLLLVALVVLGGLAGCFGAGLFSTKAPWDKDWGKRPDGEIYARDTDRNWQQEAPMLQQLIDKEAASAPPPLSKKSWSEYWVFYFHYLRGNQENPEKYVVYIIERRRALGLPEIVFSRVETPAAR